MSTKKPPGTGEQDPQTFVVVEAYEGSTWWYDAAEIEADSEAEAIAKARDGLDQFDGGGCPQQRGGEDYGPSMFGIADSLQEAGDVADCLLSARSAQDHVVLAVSDGSLHQMSIPPGLVVEVRDYEVPPEFESGYFDEDGDRYQRITFAGENARPDDVTAFLAWVANEISNGRHESADDDESTAAIQRGYEACRSLPYLARLEPKVGSWTIGNHQDANRFVINPDGEGSWVAVVQMNGEMLPDAQESAVRAMAGAPDLLTAIDNLAATYDEDRSTVSRHMMDRLLHAAKQATGAPVVRGGGPKILRNGMDTYTGAVAGPDFAGPTVPIRVDSFTDCLKVFLGGEEESAPWSVFIERQKDRWFLGVAYEGGDNICTLYCSHDGSVEAVWS